MQEAITCLKCGDESQCVDPELFGYEIRKRYLCGNCIEEILNKYVMNHKDKRTLTKQQWMIAYWKLRRKYRQETLELVFGGS
jgi:hypothetical protein